MTLADALAALAGTALPVREAVEGAAALRVVDWVGCALGGSREPAARAARAATATAIGAEAGTGTEAGTEAEAGAEAGAEAEASAEAGAGCTVLGAGSAAGTAAGGACTVLGTGRRAPAADAAFVNGTAGHALDYDDEHPAFYGHPGAVVVPAALAVAERRGAGGRELLAAVAAGYEAAALLGRAANPAHYLAGWHATATLGGVAAAVAAARLLELSAEAARAAVSLACTRAAGVRAAFGSDAKPLQVGAAAATGVLAATLAGAGATAPADLLPAYLAAAGAGAGGAGVHAGAPREPGPGGPGATGEATRPAVLEASVKYHATCGAAHCVIEAVAGTVRRHRIEPAAISRLDLHVTELSAAIAAVDVPTSTAEARFSLRHLAALAASAYPITPSALDAPPPPLRDLVRVHTDLPPAAPGDHHPAHIQIVTTDGATYQTRVDDTHGSPADPLSDGELDGKFLSLAGPILGTERAKQLLADLRRLPDQTTLPRLS